jgi:hypothetical protein
MTIRTTIPMLLCSAIALSVTGARADTRDEVLSGIQRCGVIHDDRVWLDCLYGADQPMRAHLGLQPAPEFQQRLVPAGPVMPLSAMPAEPVAAPPPRVATRPAPRKKTGFFATLLGETAPISVSKMASYRYDKSGAFIVTLENGQQWRQTDADSGVRASWMRPPSTYTVTVTPGAFGSYSLRTDDNPYIYKVEMVH